MQNKEQHSQIGSSTPLNFGAFKFFDLILVITLFDKLALNLKHKSGVRRNVWGVALLAVGHGSWYGQLPPAPHLHPHQPHVPTLDHLTCADLELERFARGKLDSSSGAGVDSAMTTAVESSQSTTDIESSLKI